MSLPKGFSSDDPNGFGKRKFKVKEYNNEICICGHRWSEHVMGLFTMGGACEACCCHKYKRDKTLPKVKTTKPVYTLKERLRSII